MIASVKTLLAASLLLAMAGGAFCQEAEKQEPEKQEIKKEPPIRFHSGAVLAAELLPECQYAPTVMNVSKFEPPSRITSDVAYATVTVKLDQGRSLSVYDFILTNKRKDEFKCIGISEGDNRYDAEKWEFSTARAAKLYTMLFKVQLPAFNDKDEYFLRYMLNKNKFEAVIIPFVRINRIFTSVSKVPSEGIIGVDPEPPPPPKPVEEVKPEPPKEEPKKEEPPAKSKKEEPPAKPKKEEAPAPAPAKEVAASAVDTMLKFVPDSKSYQVIYELDLVKSNNAIKYEIDNHLAFNKPFDRIAYYIELKLEKSELQYVYVSMDAFTNDLGKIGVPTVESKACFQQLVANMEVFSNVKGIVVGKGLKGNIEFWPNGYREKNDKSVPNASSEIYDFGDEMSKEIGHGSMQIHNYVNRQTLFAFNNWAGGKIADLGLGNSSGSASDWTFSENAGSYKIKKIRMLVHPK